MVKAVSRTFPLDLMMKSVHFQVKKRLSFELQKVAVGLSSKFSKALVHNIFHSAYFGKKALEAAKRNNLCIES